MKKDGYAQWEIQCNNIQEFCLKQIGSITKGQLISKANFETKKRTLFFISALASKMGQIIKIRAHYHANKYLIIDHLI